MKKNVQILAKHGEKNDESRQRDHMDFGFTGGQCSGRDKDDKSVLSGLSKPKPLTGTFNEKGNIDMF